jgi:hypothetical protein
MACACAAAAAQPAPGDIMPLSEVRAGQRGEVWTVFRGVKPEAFAVEVSGVVLNALGPGKSIILCRLTDPRVQDMGAVAGMSGSPLYIDGRFAGALSYQMQHFETVRYAGFTPAADMEEVAERRVRIRQPPPAGSRIPRDPRNPGLPTSAIPGFSAMRPVFALGGVSPRTASIMAPRFESLGLSVVAVGGSSQGSLQAAVRSRQPRSRPGRRGVGGPHDGRHHACGTGTVSRVDGNRVVAFGHPMLGLGDVQLPMCSAEVVAILPVHDGVVQDREHRPRHRLHQPGPAVRRVRPPRARTRDDRRRGRRGARRRAAQDPPLPGPCATSGSHR